MVGLTAAVHGDKYIYHKNCSLDQRCVQNPIKDLSYCGFESRYSDLNFGYKACFEQEFLDIQATTECRFTGMGHEENTVTILTVLKAVLQKALS